MIQTLRLLHFFSGVSILIKRKSVSVHWIFVTSKVIDIPVKKVTRALEASIRPAEVGGVAHLSASYLLLSNALEELKGLG